MFPNLTEILLILAIVVVVFGVGKLTALGTALGKIPGSFKKGLEDDSDKDDEAIDITPVDRSSPGAAEFDPKPGTSKPPVEDAELLDDEEPTGDSE